jgi:hypothetical protein
MKKENLHNRTAALLLSFGLALSQLPALAAVTGEGSTAPQSDNLAKMLAVKTAQPASASIATAIAQSSPGVEIRATKDENPSVLSGHITSNVENLSKGILQDEVKLQRFNLQFRVNAARQGRWKGWRYFVAQNGGLMAGAAGDTVYVSDGFDHIHADERDKRNDHHLIGGQSKNLRANGGLLPSAVGQMVQAGGSLLEFSINEYHSAQARQNGYGFAQSRDTALKLVADIDKKLAERERLIKEQPADNKETAEMQELEGKVLADFRDMGIAEFERYHVGARKTLAQQNSFYLLDAFFKNSTGIIANMVGMHDILRKGHPGLDATAGTFSIISGMFVVADPMLSRMYSKMVEKHAKASLERHGLPTIWEKNVPLEQDWGRLQSYCQNHQVKDRPELAALVGRLDAYDANHKFITDELQRNARAIRRGNRTAVQNMGMATIIGMSKIAGPGILPCVAGARYFHQNNQRFVLFSTGGLVYLPALYLGVMDNWRIQVGNEVRRANQAKAHALPGQIIKDRLIQLNTIEKKI